MLRILLCRHLLKLSAHKISQDLRHGGDNLSVASLSQHHLADAQDVDPAVDGLGLVPLGADGGLASPRLSSVNHVIMEQGAGVEHLSDHSNLFLQTRHLVTSHSQVTVHCRGHGHGDSWSHRLALTIKIIFRHHI